MEIFGVVDGVRSRDRCDGGVDVSGVGQCRSGKKFWDNIQGKAIGVLPKMAR